MPEGKKVIVKIERQDGAGAPVRWEEFHVDYRPNANVISVLMQIQRNPVTADGKKTTPPSYDTACLEEVCGSCTMNINGKVRQACSTLIDHLEQPITLQPMKKFPLVRDLSVDRQKMFVDLKRIRAWVPIDGTYDLGPGPKQSPDIAEMRYVMSTCMTCGCCLEVCPQYGQQAEFVGAFALNQVRLFNLHPTGAMNADERLRSLMEPGGVGDCGKAGNCVTACPKGIPLTSSIAEMARETTKQSIKDFLFRDERKGGAGPG